MAIQPSVFQVTMVSGASLTSALDLRGSWGYVYLAIPTMTGGFGADTTIILRGSADGTTFYPYVNPGTATFATSTDNFVIASSTTQRVVYLPNFSLRYVQLETTAVATAGVTSNTPFKFICVPNQ